LSFNPMTPQLKGRCGPFRGTFTVSMVGEPVCTLQVDGNVNSTTRLDNPACCLLPRIK
jgi:hypothetical protein